MLNLYTATGNFVCVLVCYALLGENVLPVSFVTCSDPVGVCNLYSRDCLASRDRPLPFVFGFQKMIAVGGF